MYNGKAVRLQLCVQCIPSLPYLSALVLTCFETVSHVITRADLRLRITEDQSWTLVILSPPPEQSMGSVHVCMQVLTLVCVWQAVLLECRSLPLSPILFHFVFSSFSLAHSFRRSPLPISPCQPRAGTTSVQMSRKIQVWRLWRLHCKTLSQKHKIK